MADRIDRSMAGLAAQAGGIVKIVSGKRSAEVSSIEYDSRRVKPGSLFVAVKGLSSDGHDFVHRAVDAGASAVAVSSERTGEFMDISGKASLLSYVDARRSLSQLSAAFYGHPSMDMTVIGVTGTNGKTSITYMLESILKKAGMNPGVIGTVNYRWNDRLMPAPNTTPESRDLHEILYNMLNDGVDTAIMEVSSHALALGRADDIDFDVAIFTNLTGDHLDFHKDMEDYFGAKSRLFELLDRGLKERRGAAVNADDEYGRRILSMADKLSYPVYGFGLSKDAAFRPDSEKIFNRITGLSYALKSPFKLNIDLRLAGRFHVSNTLAAITAASILEIPSETIAAGLHDLSTVPGRFDVIHSEKGFSAVVDYAHTGDALLKLLQSVNELEHRRIITVFGCGGDRDKTKRPVMGRIASENSDHVIVTSDNPRSEEPAAIIEDIVKGIVKDNYEIVPDRELAIRMAIEGAEKYDIIVIAGKGHEDYQIIGKEKIHFDDRELAREFMLTGRAS